MTAPPTCPRCGGPLREPSLWSSAWECDRHGGVHPYRAIVHPTNQAVEHLAKQARVPVWLPQPPLPGWMVTGLGHAGDGRTGARATAVACSGPSPVGGPADLILIAEEPGVGLGARYAGLLGPDPGIALEGAPDAKLIAAGHPTPLWSVPCADDCAVFVGEAKAVWLWAVLWPATAELVLLEHVRLADLRDGAGHELVFGAPSPYLAARPLSSARRRERERQHRAGPGQS